jgi:hypothetical protein
MPAARAPPSQQPPGLRGCGSPRELPRLLGFVLCITLTIPGLVLLVADTRTAAAATLDILATLGVEEATRSWLDGIVGCAAAPAGRAAQARQQG